MTRMLAVATGALALVSMAGVLVAAPAQAAAYRYWTYWQGAADGWTFAVQGPGTSVPPDGAVEGWSFAISQTTGSRAAQPAAPADFAAICADTPPESGRKRVALVVDPGAPGLGPARQSPPARITTCVTAESDATGYDVLRSVADVRTEGGLVCGIAGYPAGECAPVIDDAEVAAAQDRVAQAAPGGPPVPSARAAAAAAAGSDASTPADPRSPVATIVVAVLLIAGAAVGISLRRRSG